MVETVKIIKIINKLFLNKNMSMFLFKLSFIITIISNTFLLPLEAKTVNKSKNNKDESTYLSNQKDLISYIDKLKKIDTSIINLKLSSKEKSLFYTDIKDNLSKLKESINSKESLDSKLKYLEKLNTLLSKSFRYSEIDSNNKNEEVSVNNLDNNYTYNDNFKFEIVPDDYYNVFKLNKALSEFQELDKSNYIRYNLELIHIYDRLNLNMLAFNSIHNIINEISKNVYEYKEDILDILNIIQDVRFYSLVFKKELKTIYSLILYGLDSINRYEYTTENSNSNKLDSIDLEKIEYIKLYLSKGFISIGEYDTALLRLEELSFSNNNYIKYLSKYFISYIYQEQSNDKESRLILESIFNDKKEVELYFSIINKFYSNKNNRNNQNITDMNREYFVFNDTKYEDIFYLELAVNDLANYYIEDNKYVEALELISYIQEDSVVYEDIYYTKVYINYLLNDNNFEILASSFLIKYPYSYKAYYVKIMLASVSKDFSIIDSISKDIDVKIQDVKSLIKEYLSLGSNQDFNDTKIYNLNISKLFKSIDKYIILDDNDDLNLWVERNILSSKKLLDKVLQNNINDINEKISYLNSLNNNTFYVEDVLKIAQDILKEKYDLIFNSIEDKDKINLLDNIKDIDRLVGSSKKALSKEKVELKILLSFLTKDIEKISDNINYDTVNKIIEDLDRYVQDTRFLENIESNKVSNSNLKPGMNVYINKIFIKDFINKLDKYFYIFDSKLNYNEVLSERNSSIAEKFEQYKNLINQTLISTESFEIYLEQEIISTISSIKKIFVNIEDMNEELYRIVYNYKKGINDKSILKNYIKILNQKLLSMDIEKQNISLSNFKQLNEDIILNNKLIDLLKRGKTK